MSEAESDNKRIWLEDSGKRVNAEEGAPRVRRPVAMSLCVGFGAFLAYLPTGPVGTALISSLVSREEVIPLARGAFFLIFALVLLGLKAGNARDVLHRTSWNLCAYISLFLSVALELIVGSVGMPDVGAVIGSALSGAASAVLSIGWLEGFFALYRARGKGACVIALATCSLVSVLLSPVQQLFGSSGWVRVIGSWGTLVLLCLVCHRYVAHVVIGSRDFPSTVPAGQGIGGSGRPGDEQHGGAGIVPSGEFRASVYIGAVGLSFGFVWMTSCSLAARLGFGQRFGDGPFWGIVLAGVLVNLGVIILCQVAPQAIERKFGRTLRWVIAIIGVAWSFIPALSDVFPASACFLCALVYTLVTTFVALLVIELCEQRNVTVCAVAGTLSVLFVSGLVVGIVVYGTIMGLSALGYDDHVCCSLVCGASAATLFLTMPFLPSIRSEAIDLSRDRLPENEGFEERLELEKHALFEKAGLTPREIAIVELIVLGRTRAQIAEELSLSQSTVKNHVTSINRKLGVNSGRELSALVLGLDSADTFDA